MTRNWSGWFRRREQREATTTPPSTVPPERRSLEERIADVEAAAKRFDGVLDRQLKTITLIFSLAAGATVVFGLLITALGWISKNEVSTAVRDMERRFEALAGQALKAPVLRIFYEGAELDRRELAVRVEPSGDFRLSELNLQNTGDRHTETLSIRLLFDHPVFEAKTMFWQRTPSPDAAFATSFWWPDTHAPISPRETWSTNEFFGRVQGAIPSEMRAKVLAYYGRERPAEATFTIRLKK